MRTEIVWYGRHYEMFRLAATFRDMVRTNKEPIPHEEIVAVTTIVHAAPKSLPGVEHTLAPG